MIFSGLINNITLIISLSILYSFIIRRWKYGSRIGQAISGFLFGAVAVVGMMNPVTISPGLIFDGRSIIISMAGFIGGWVTALIASLMGIIYRAWLGGPGEIMGVSVIASSAAIGIAYHYLRRRRPHVVTPLYLIGFGIIVHICMLALTMTLPSSMRFQVLSNIAIPVILIYPLGTLLVGAVFLDLESRLRAEEALQESEARYRELFENAGEAIFVAQDGKLVFHNQRTVKVIGYSDEELLSKPFIEFIQADDRSRFLDWELRRINDEELPRAHSFRIIRGDGNIRWVELKTVVLNWKRTPATLNFLSDVTDRKRAEEKLRESEKRYRELYDFLPIPVYEMDLEANITSANRAIYETFRGTTEDLKKGIKIWQLLPPEEIERSNQNIQRLLKGEPVKDTEYTLMRLDGSVFPALVISSVIFSEGQRVGLRGAIIDISERQRAEEEKRSLEERLQRAEKMEALGLLAGGVAHDLNNVLGIVVGYAELLLDDLNESSPMRDNLLNIMDGGQRAAAIVQDLLTLTRRGVAGRKILNLDRLILDLMKSAELEKLRSYHPAVQIKTDLEPDLLNISGSSLHLEKSLFNLASNACEAMPKGGDLTIKTTNRYLDKPIQGYDHIREGDYVVLSVSDTGEGISAADLKRIFEPFYTKKIMGRSGTGLGLAVVWGTVKDHNGYIDVQSEGGKGTLFTLYFPVAREEITAEASSVLMTEYLGRGEVILVVDDIKGQRDLAAAMLRKLNYRVASVSSGEEAIEYLREQEVDLLVLDMIMEPGMDGLDTYTRILEIHPLQKAIIVSGFSESDRVTAAQTGGAGEYVKKPFVLEKLGLAVRKELEKT